MGESVRTRKGKLAERGEHDARLGRVVKKKKLSKAIRRRAMMIAFITSTKVV